MVSDDKPWVPEKNRDSIFKPYELANTDNTQPASVGLGRFADNRPD